MPDHNDPRLARPAGPASLFQVASGAVAVRKAPQAGAEAATFALHGETLSVFGQEGAFARVQCQRDRYTGWALAADLAPAVLTSTHKVAALRTFAFSAPDVKSPPVLTLSLGARVTATGRREGVWVECARAGWIHEAHLAGPSVFEEDPAEVASRFLGVPYLWGGRESLGLDCSGLTQQAFEACGVLLPRDSDMQMAWSGTEVTLPVSKSTQNDTVWAQNDTFRRGDLIFWEGHVGILTAPGRLLHANAHHMMTAEEPLAEAIERIGKTAGPVLCVRRIDLAAERRQPPTWLDA